MEEKCIFVSRPEECSICIPARKLQCLLNKRHLMVSNEGALELSKLLWDRIHDPDRYKVVSGEEGRYGGSKED